MNLMFFEKNEEYPSSPPLNLYSIGNLNCENRQSDMKRKDKRRKTEIFILE